MKPLRLLFSNASLLRHKGVAQQLTMICNNIGYAAVLHAFQAQ
jgi:hypothetical protein